MGRRAKQSAQSSGVFSGRQTDRSGIERELNMAISELVDAASGNVTLTLGSLGIGASEARLMINSREYARWRLLVLYAQVEALKRELFRNEVRAPVPKPSPSRKKAITTALVCPDCDGSGYARGGECQRCRGACWISA